MIPFTVRVRGRPQRPSRPAREHAVVEILPEQPQLPELVGDVLADVGDRAVRSHDDLLALFVCVPRFIILARVAAVALGGLARVLNRHHPAACETSFLLQIHCAACFQDVEGLRPELQPQDVAFPRQQVVIDIHPRHRLEMRADDAVGDEARDRGVLVATVLDVVQHLGPHRQPGLVLLVPIRHARVQVPAVVIEAGAIGRFADLVERLAFEHLETDDHVGDLDARIVDVILNLYRHAAEAQRSNERVAEGGVAQVTDMRRLVRIDRGVLDDGLSLGDPRRRRAAVCETFEKKRRALEKEIQIAVRCRGHTRNAFERSEGAGNLLRDRARRLAQAAGQLERDRRTEVTQFAIRRIVEDDACQRLRVEAVERPQHAADVCADAVVNGQDHRRRVTVMAEFWIRFGLRFSAGVRYAFSNDAGRWLCRLEGSCVIVRRVDVDE